MYQENHYCYDFTPQGLEAGLLWTSPQTDKIFAGALSLPQRDLLNAVLAAYTADRASKRFRTAGSIGGRCIMIRLPVYCLELWRGEVSQLLCSLLSWMSGDKWRFEFVARARPAYALFPSPTLHFRNATCTSLFSGGLDSLAGLVARSKETELGSHLLLSVYTHNRLQAQQRKQVQGLHKASSSICGDNLWKSRFTHIHIKLGIKKPNPLKEEKSQRTRALVFLCLGAITAKLAGTEKLHVYENGIGALNLPLNESQLGVDNYRGVHPITLLKAERLFETALGHSCVINNPCQFLTKAQMCSYFQESELANLISETVSCDSYPLREGVPQCGTCTSCILRRQALKVAKLPDSNTGYLRDVWRSGKSLPLPCWKSSQPSLFPNYLDPKQANNGGGAVNETSYGTGHLYGWFAMQDQVHQLRGHIESDDAIASLYTAFPSLSQVAEAISKPYGLERKAIGVQIAKLFQRYVEEWSSISESPI